MKYHRDPYIELCNLITPQGTADLVEIDESTLPDCEDSQLPDTFKGDAVLRLTEMGDSSPLFSPREKDHGFASFSDVYRRFVREKNVVTVSVVVPAAKEACVRKAIAEALIMEPLF